LLVPGVVRRVIWLVTALRPEMTTSGNATTVGSPATSLETVRRRSRQRAIRNATGRWTFVALLGLMRPCLYIWLKLPMMAIGNAPTVRRLTSPSEMQPAEGNKKCYR